jgi:hypothetical protein
MAAMAALLVLAQFHLSLVGFHWAGALEEAVLRTPSQLITQL